jgi:signal transduction histidine kinase
MARKDDEAVKHLVALDNQVNRLTNLVTELLEASKIQAGKFNYNYTNFDIKKLLEEIIDEAQLTSNKHKLIADLSHSKTIFADKERVTQVITNLLSNAIKFSPEAKKILITSEIQKKHISVSIQDFGIGIPPKYHEHIFDKFFRVPEDAIKKYHGLGLGLYISSKIILCHGGTLEVKSKVGKGSTFTFTLPFKAV